MASETLEEKKPDDGATVEEKEEVKEEEDEGQSKEEADEEEREQSEAEVKEEGDSEEKETSPVNEESEEVGVAEKGEESKGEEEGTRKAKRGRKPSSKKGEGGSKKAGQESREKKSSSKEPVTPNERPTRERKTVERYSAPSSGKASASKGLSIEKGRGTQLKDIPNVVFKLSKRKPDDNLQILHTILFGKKTKTHSLKRNIGQFSGYVWVENEEKQKARVKEKLDKCVKEKLMDFCDVLNIPINKANVKKEEVSAKLLEFLEAPQATTDILLADKEQKGKKRKRKSTPSKITSSGEASAETPVKHVVVSHPTMPPQVGEKQKRLSKVEEEDDVDDKIEPSNTSGDSHEDDGNDIVPKDESDQEESKSEEEEDEPKEQMSSQKSSSKKNVKENLGAKTSDKSTPVKKGVSGKSVKSPAKSTKSSSSTLKKGAAVADGTSGLPSKSKRSATKKQKVEKESQEARSVSAKEKATSKKPSSKSPAKVLARDQGKGKTSKKAKAEPSREEMHAVVVDILKEVDFNTATLSDILRQLGTHFGVDLMHRKSEVKAIITDVINNMTDEEDDGEEAEAGDDADKDGDGEDDDDA